MDCSSRASLSMRFSRKNTGARLLYMRKKTTHVELLYCRISLLYSSFAFPELIHTCLIMLPSHEDILGPLTSALLPSLVLLESLHDSMVSYANHIFHFISFYFIFLTLAKFILLVPVLKYLKITDNIIQLGWLVSCSQTWRMDSTWKILLCFLNKHNFLLLCTLKITVSFFCLVPQIFYLLFEAYSCLMNLILS